MKAVAGLVGVFAVLLLAFAVIDLALFPVSRSPVTEPVLVACSDGECAVPEVTGPPRTVVVRWVKPTPPVPFDQGAVE